MELIDPHSEVIELGCGIGDLLLRLSPKIKTGLGIDTSRKAIDDAIRQRDKRNIHNVDFACTELGPAFPCPDTYDYSVASLFFHVVPLLEAVYLLNRMREISHTVLICGFSRPKTLDHKILMWLDQRFSKHYGNFKGYQEQGYMKGLLERVQCRKVITYNTHIPFLKIYELN